MGSHAGCHLGICAEVVAILLAHTNPLDPLVPSGESTAELRMPFMVGINQIELGAHGSQNYQFLPELRTATHHFRNVTAAVEMPGLSAMARLYPEGGRSSTRFESVDRTQAGFFPSHQHLELFLEFTLRFSDPSPLAGVTVVAANREPFRFRTAQPLTGFPALYDPPFVIQEPVEFFDVTQPEAPPIFRIVENEIAPHPRVLFEVSPRITGWDSATGDFQAAATLTLVDHSSSVTTAVHFLPTRGVEMQSAEERIVVNPGATSDVVFRGRVVDRTEPHLAVSVRPYSLDPAVPGAGRAEVSLDFAMGVQHATALDIVEPSRNVVFAGETLTFQAAPVLTPAAAVAPSPRQFIWVAPHGVEVSGVDGPNATIVAPDVPYRSDLWMTLYVRDETGVSGPRKFEFEVRPTA